MSETLTKTKPAWLLKLDEAMSAIRDNKADLKALQAQYDEKIKEVDDEFNPTILPLKDEIAELTKDIDDALMKFGQNFFDEETRSAELENGLIKATYSTATGLAEGYDDEKACGKIEEKLPTFADNFIIVKRSLDKTAIKKALKAKKLTKADLKRCGVLVEEFDNFSFKVFEDADETKGSAPKHKM